ncbi:hypothetical protein F5X99DRAFT_355715 [Biscogniauxia marginata]|nr:hypothetical protein F5X99DRAFT_355715 [Biscogniauxia marginata]
MELNTYTHLVEEISGKFRQHISRCIMSLKELPTPLDDASSVREKIMALRLRKELLQDEVRILKDKASNHIRIERVIRTEASIMEHEPGFYYDHYDFDKVHRLFKVNTTSYDHVLSKLQALGGELNYDDSTRDAMLFNARRGASQVILNLAHNCHTQLNIVFQEAALTYAVNAPNIPEYGRVIHQERDAIASEIQSLWDEVVPVAHMAVERQYLKPILDSVNMANESREVRNATICAYASAVLRFMNERLTVLAERIQTLVYHHQALFNAFHYLEARARDDDPKYCPRIQSHTVKLVTPVGEHNANLVELVRHYMHVYGSIPVDVDYDPLESPIKTISKIDEYVQSRAEKGLEIAQDMHKFFETAVKAGLVDTELGGHIILDCVLADSATGFNDSGVFADQQLEESVAATKEQIRLVRRIFHGLQLTGAETAPDFVADAYKKTAECLAAKNGNGCFKPGFKSTVTCPKCIRCLHFENLLRRWGDHST